MSTLIVLLLQNPLFQSGVSLLLNLMSVTFRPVILQGWIVGGVSANNFNIANDGYGCRIAEGDIGIAKDHLASSEWFEVMLFDPFGWFGRVTAFGPVPE